MPRVPEDQSVEGSAKRLGMSKKMLDIQQFPMPESQASNTAAGNIVPGNSAPADLSASPRMTATAQTYTSPLPPQGVPEVSQPVNEYDDLAATEEANPYDALLEQDRSGQKTAIQSSMFAATAKEPDRAAKVRALSRETNLPEDIVDRNFDTLARKVKVENADYDSLIDSSPSLAAWLAEPKNAELAHDDVPQLSYLERQVRHIRQQFQAGKRTTELADIGMSALKGDISESQRKRQGEIDQELGNQEDYGIKGFWEGIPGAVANQGPIFAKTFKGSLAGAGVGFTGGAAIGAGAAVIAGQLGPQVAVPEEVVTVPAAALASGTTGAFWGYRVGSAIEAGKMEASLAYLDLEKVKDSEGLPLDRSTMVGASLAVGAINGALETVGLETALKAAPGFKQFQRGAIKKAFNNPTTRAALIKFSKAVAEGMAGEGITEGLQSLVTTFSKTVAKAYQDKTLPTWDSNKIMEALTEAFQEARAGAQAGGGMTTVTGGASLAVDVREVRKAEEAKAAYQALGEAASATKLSTRDGESLGKLVHETLKDGDTQHVYIPVQAMTAYFQDKGVPIEQVAAELGIDQELQEASATGGDLKIPLAKYVEKVVGTEHWKALEGDVKFDPDGLTPNEAQAIRKEIEARAKALDESQKPQESMVTEQPGGTIFQTIQEQLKAAGLSKEEQRYNPKLIESFFTTLGQELGVDPTELAGRFPLQIQRFQDMAERDATRAGEGAQAAQNQLSQPAAIESQLQSEIAIPEQIGNPEIAPNAALGSMAPEELRKASLEKAKGKTLRGSFPNAHTGWTIEVSGEGLKKTANATTRPEQALALENLPVLIQNAIFLRSAADRSGGGGVRFNYLYSPFMSGGKPYVAKIAMRESQGGRNKGRQTFYSLHVQEIKKPAGQASELSPAGASSIVPTAAGMLNKADLLAYVNEARETTELFQDGEGEGPRGQITFGGRKFNIDLFKKKDRSTFLHETGHFFLEVMGEIVEGEGRGSERLKADYAALLEWFGVQSREDITTEHHEKFARAFETYLSEGKAPSLALRDAFSSFRRWLTRLWKKVSMQKVEVSPELKELFDRMLATEQQIDEARKAMNMADEIGGEALPDATKAELARLQERARARAEEALLRERLSETKSEYREKLAKEREKLRIAAEEQVSQEPIFLAIDALGGKRAYEIAEKALRGEVTPEQGAQFELLADEFGFLTAEELAREISEAGASGLFEEKVGALVTEGLRQAGMIKDAAALREEALKAIHSDQMAELLALEREALLDLAQEREVREEVKRRNRAVAREEARAAADEAARILAQRPAYEAGRPQSYITMERNAAARASRFLAKKEYDKAAQAKREQLVAHAMVRESFRINEEYERHIKYVTQFTNRGASLLGMPYSFVRQVDALLARYGFQAARQEDLKVNQEIASRMEGEGAELNDIANATGLAPSEGGAWAPESFADFIARQNENYHAMIIPESVRLMQATDPDTITIDELQDFRETVEMLVTGGRKHDRFLTEFIKVDAKQAALDIRKSIEEKIGKPREGDFAIDAGQEDGISATIKSILSLPDAVIPSMVNVETLASFLDKGKDGPVRKFIYRIMSASEDRKQVMLEKAIKDVNAILKRHYTEQELASYKKEKFLAIRGFDKSLTREQVLAMALNWGNQTNRDRVLMGYKIDLSTAQDALNQLDKKDWEFAQEVWDYFDTYWPDIKRLEMKVKGIEPVKVAATNVVTKFGVYKGGYYPIAYDHAKSAEAHKMNEQRSELYKQYSAAQAHTERGHAEARVSRVKRPVRLSLDVIFDHLENVIHDISYREAVIDVNRLLREHDVKQAIQNAIGLKGYLTFDKWLQDIASDQRQSLQPGERLLSWFRMKTTMSSLGFRAFTVPMDLTGNVINAIHEIGPSRMMRAIGDHVFSRGETNEFVAEKSDYMRQREKTLDRDLSDLNRKWSKEKPIFDKALSKVFGKDIALANFAFFFQRFSDDAIAKPLWKEVYRDALGRMTEEEAVQLANEAVKRTLGSGSPIDLVGAQRGSELKKFFTMYFSWSSMMFNRAWLDGRIAGLEYREGNVLPALAVAARGAFFLWFLHAVNENFWREILRNSQGKDDDDERMKRIATRFAQQPFGYVWIGRDVAALTVSLATTGRGSFKPSPAFSALELVLTPPGKAIHFAFTDPKKFDGRFLEESAKAASVLLGTPQSLNTMAFNFIDEVNGNGELTWKDAISRRQKK